VLEYKTPPTVRKKPRQAGAHPAAHPPVAADAL